MKLGLLKVSNIGPFLPNTVYDFGREGINVIIGINNRSGLTENGVGKSWIPDALSWVLYGKTIRGSKKDNVLNDNSNHGSALINLAKDGWNYTVTRTISRKSSKLLLTRNKGKIKQSLTCQKITDTQFILLKIKLILFYLELQVKD